MNTFSQIIDVLHYQKGILAETKKYNHELMARRNQHFNPKYMLYFPHT